MPRKQKVMLGIVIVLAVAVGADYIRGYLKTKEMKAQYAKESKEQMDYELGNSPNSQLSQNRESGGTLIASSNLQGLTQSDLGLSSGDTELQPISDFRKLHRDLELASIEAQIAKKRLEQAQADRQIEELSHIPLPDSGGNQQRNSDEPGVDLRKPESTSKSRKVNDASKAKAKVKERLISTMESLSLVGISDGTAYLRSKEGKILHAQRGTTFQGVTVQSIRDDNVTLALMDNSKKRIVRIDQSVGPYVHAPVQPLEKSNGSDDSDMGGYSQ